MFVPLKFVFPLLLLVPLAVWFAGTRKYDFMTPRDIPDAELRPAFASPVNRELADSLKPPPPEPEPDPIVEIDPGNLFQAPVLAQYLSESSKGPAALLQLASKLQNEGRIQRAVLAYERILDSTPVGGQERVQAEEALASLKTSLPLWNADSEKSLPLTIHLVTARSRESLQPSITALSELITVSSGNLCEPVFQVQEAPLPAAPLPALPIALWLTVEGEDPENPSLTVLTIAPESEEALDSRLTHALYRLIRRRLKNDAEITEPPTLLLDDDPEVAIVTKITRLTWQKLLRTPFQSLPVEEPPVPILPAHEESLENNPQ